MGIGKSLWAQWHPDDALNKAVSSGRLWQAGQPCCLCPGILPKPRQDRKGRQRRTIQFDADVGEKRRINIGVLQGKNIEEFMCISCPKAEARKQSAAYGSPKDDGTSGRSLRGIRSPAQHFAETLRLRPRA